ncbi:hypothetical protein MYX76_17965, partial [Desulfobacterota bacterium AH_259_B03_O07]|nr:hypothetical protein [Desulfobacterota bacterium AH_259_B03_O07]
LELMLSTKYATFSSTRCPPGYCITSLFVGLNGGLFLKTIRIEKTLWSGFPYCCRKPRRLAMRGC